MLTTNRVTVLWSFAALAITLVYPFAKRFVSMPQAVLGMAFSFGIPMAFAAVRGEVPALAWWLLAGNLFWVLAYDTEYAMVDRDDDLKIGMKTSAITFGRLDVPAVMASYAIFLAIWAAAGASQALGAVFFMAIAGAAAQAVWHWRLIRERTREGCFKAFRLNHWLGFTVFAGIVAGYALRAEARRRRSAPAELLRQFAGTRLRGADRGLEAAPSPAPPPATLIAAWVVPPLEVTRSRSTAGGSLAPAASADAPVKVPTASRCACSGGRPISTPASVIASMK